MSAHDKQIETIKQRGAAAFFSGQRVEDCPYKTPGKQGQKFRRIWIAGYVEARDISAPVAASARAEGKERTT